MNDYLPIILALASFTLIIFWRSRVHRVPEKNQSTALPYRKRPYLFSKAERSFYEVLLRAAPAETKLFTKVRMADLIQVRPGVRGRRGHQNRINCKHVDFVLCTRDTLSPILAIELDDRSHRQPERQARDRFVDEAFAAAGLPLLRIPAQYGYTASELQQMIREKLAAAGVSQSSEGRSRPVSPYINGSVNGSMNGAQSPAYSR